MKIGICAATTCGIDVYRGDHFVVLLGEVVVCRPCFEKGAGINMNTISTEGEEAA